VAELPLKVQCPPPCGLNADVRRLYVQECHVERLELGGGHQPGVRLAKFAAQARVPAGRAKRRGLVSQRSACWYWSQSSLVEGVRVCVEIERLVAGWCS
jgi:hypothetical protein